MRYFFFFGLAILFISCIETTGTLKKEGKKVFKDSIISFTCNYPIQKTRSNQLYNLFKENPADSVRKRLIHNIRDSLFSCWLGTPWDFNGTTEEPGKGKIACGYFVTTVLRDIGLPLKRIKLAQCASEEMILAVCKNNTIKRFRNASLTEFVVEVKKMQPGLYIVGLDKHTGFILNDGEEVYFIHSTYVGSGVVVKEIAIESIVLASSRYRVIGKVF